MTDQEILAADERLTLASARVHLAAAALNALILKAPPTLTGPQQMALAFPAPSAAAAAVCWRCTQPATCQDNGFCSIERVDLTELNARQWWMEFELDGRPFIWTGTADNESAAETLARAELARKGLTAAARLVACVEK